MSENVKPLMDVRMASSTTTEVSVCPFGIPWRAGFKLVLLFTGCGLAVGLPLYLIQHPYAPKSPIQLSLGILGAAMMFFGAGLYALRKRVKGLKKLGQMRYWLNFHITFCLLGPLLVVYHSALTAKAPNSAVALYTMLVVVTSGIVGRYIYRHFQFTLSGDRATLKEMCEEIEHLDQKIQAHFSESQKIIATITRFFELREDQKTGGFVRSFCTMVRLDRLERRLKRQIRRYLASKGKQMTLKKDSNEKSFEEILIQRVSFEKKVSVLEVATKLFAYWHRFHVPLIWILLLTFLVHVAAVLIF